MAAAADVNTVAILARYARADDILALNMTNASTVRYTLMDGVDMKSVGTSTCTVLFCTLS